MPIYSDLDDETSAANHIERCRRDFVATGNPLFAWEAWGAFRARAARRGSLDLPEWLGVYLDDCEHNLFGLRTEFHARPGEGPGLIGRALAFGEGLAKAREHWGGPFDAREQLAHRTVEIMWAEGLSLHAVATPPMEKPSKKKPQRPPNGAGYSAVRKAVYGAQRYALKLMRDRLVSANGTAPALAEIPAAYSKLCSTRGRAKQKVVPNGHR